MKKNSHLISPKRQYKTNYRVLNKFDTCVGLAKNEQGDHYDVICIHFIWTNTLQCNLMSYVQPVQILTGQCCTQTLNPES